MTSEPFPPVAYEGSSFSLSCKVAAGSHLSYTWFFNRTEVKPSALLRPLGDQLVMDKVSQQHAGSYSCMAWSMVQDTKRFLSSLAVQLRVKGECQRAQGGFMTPSNNSSFRLSPSYSKNNPAGS